MFQQLKKLSLISLSLISLNSCNKEVTVRYVPDIPYEWIESLPWKQYMTTFKKPPKEMTSEIFNQSVKKMSTSLLKRLDELPTINADTFLQVQIELESIYEATNKYPEELYVAQTYMKQSIHEITSYMLSRMSPKEVAVLLSEYVGTLETKMDSFGLYLALDTVDLFVNDLTIKMEHITISDLKSLLPPLGSVGSKTKSREVRTALRISLNKVEILLTRIVTRLALINEYQSLIEAERLKFKKHDYNPELRLVIGTLEAIPWLSPEDAPPLMSEAYIKEIPDGDYRVSLFGNITNKKYSIKGTHIQYRDGGVQVIIGTIKYKYNKAYTAYGNNKNTAVFLKISDNTYMLGNEVLTRIEEK